MMKVLAVLPLVAAYQVMDTQNHLDLAVHSDSTYEGMKATLKSISAMQATGEIPQTTIDAVNGILTKIETQLIAALKQDENTTQNLLNDAEAAIIKCDSDKTTFVDGAHSVNTGDVTSKKGIHEGCRTGEAQACGDATNKCGTYQTQVCGFTDCEVKKPTNWQHDTDEMYDYMDCLDTFFTAERSDYYTNRQNCYEKVNTWTNKTVECDDDQEDFELAFCNTEKAVESACNTYRTCRDGKLAVYTSILNDVQELVEVYQTQAVALDLLKCYGGKILTNNTDLSACETPKSCCDLTWCPGITEPTIIAPVSCTEQDTTSPCSSGFISTYYGQYENKCSPVQTCTACTAPWSQDENAEMFIWPRGATDWETKTGQSTLFCA